MAFNTDDIQKLRDTTGAGVMDCKRAFLDAKGDFDAALRLIKERGFIKVEKRVGRETGAGFVHSYVHSERIGVLVDVRAETDFVVRSEPFRKLAHDLAMHIAAAAPADVDALLSQPYVKDESKTVADVINDVIGRVGENIRVRAFYRLEV